MTIKYRIDHERRLVMARGRDILTDQDVFAYQCEVWSRADVAGFNELMDMSEVKQIAVPSTDRMQQLATLSASMDPRLPASKFAIVAPEDLAFGLGRMYQVYRDLDSRSTRQVGVFRSLKDAWEFLGVQGEPELGDCDWD